MRFSLFLALAVTGLGLTAAGQTFKQPKTKPAHKEQQAKKAAPAKEPKSPTNSSAQELRRAEQSSTKVTGAKHGQGKAPKAGLMKTQREKPNPPIRFSSAKGAGSGLNAKGGNAYKGRLRQKGGSHHH